jgi:hypothetical protein
MAEKQSSASLVQKLTLLVLVLILGCLGAILYKLREPAAPPLETGTPPPAKAGVESSEPPAAPPTNLIEPARVSRPGPAPLRPAATRPSVAPRPPVEAAREPAAPASAAASAPVAAATTPGAAPATAVAEGAPPLVFEALPVGSEMRIDGDSTLHKWHCLGKIIAGRFEADPRWLASPPEIILKGGPSPRCEITIPIRTLKSQVAVGSSVMDSRMQAEMKANRFPSIH